MRDRKILIFIIVVLVAYFFYSQSKTTDSGNYDVPSEYKGVEGLNYIRNNYASQLSQARSLCITQFKGEWIDTSNRIGCYNMEGFSPAYCGLGIIKDLVNLCNAIDGSPTCSSSEAGCTV